MAEPEFPAVDRLVSDAQRRRAMAVMEQEREKARILKEIQAKDKPLEDPWIDPVSAFAGGFGGALPNALRRLGTMGLKALMRPAVSGAAGAAADIPIGAATEKIGEKVPGAALPFNVLAGMGSGATVGRMFEEAISNPRAVWDAGVRLAKQELGEIFGHHGSHALFPRFRGDKVGTGEGSQAFGWGAYVTSSPEIGKNYAVMKTGKDGYLYDVTIHKNKKPEEYDYLKWFENITDTQKNKLMSALSENKMKLRTPSLRGQDVYDSLAWSFVEKEGLPLTMGKPGMEAQRKASEFLKGAGIDGVEYPSGTITGKNQGATNYVVFSPDDISINDVRKISQE